jgi:hypothetical protein
MSQLVTADRAVVLRQIQAMRNWLPDPARVLPMGTYAIADVAFGKTLPDKMHVAITRSLDACFHTRDVNQIVRDAGRLRDYLDAWKAKEADILSQFKRSCEEAREAGLGQPERSKIEAAIREGLTMRVGEAKTATLALGLRRSFSALFEYEEKRSLVIGNDRHYNPANPKNINDAFDSEQLVYLYDPNIRFITCDRKYQRRVTECKQSVQIITVNSAELRDPVSAATLLRRVTA